MRLWERSVDNIWHASARPSFSPPSHFPHNTPTHSLSAVSTSGFHSVAPVPFSFHLILKSPNSNHYSPNWWALTPPASGPVDLVVISRLNL